MKIKERVRLILARLDDHYPDARCTLDFANPFELLVGGILAAQCTDQRVNLVLPELFSRYPDAKTMASASPEDLQPFIKSCGLYKNKAKALSGSAAKLAAEHDGQVPAEMAALLELPGVGRKIANLIRGDGFAIPGVVVDTHCGRVAFRLGLTKKKDPAGIERDLERLIPPDWQIRFGHLMVAHGRALCTARKPDCKNCFLTDICPKAGVTLD